MWSTRTFSPPASNGTGEPAMHRDIARTIADVSATSVRRARYSARMRLATMPTLYLPIARWHYRDVADRVVGPDTELVIDGFQRSANTFASIAFEISQPRRCSTAHHLHAASQIVSAARLQVPCLLLVRDPVDAVISQLQRVPQVTPHQALANWSRFHERVVPYREQVVIAGFREVTTDFGAVIAAVNARFGTTFTCFEHTDANVRRVFDLMDARNRERYGTLREDMVPRPSTVRGARQDEVRAKVESPSTAKARRRAYETYAEFMHGSVGGRARRPDRVLKEDRLD